MKLGIFFNIGALTETKGDYKNIYEKAVKSSDLNSLKDSYKDYKEKFFKFFQEGWTYPRRQAMDRICREKGCDPAKVEKFIEEWENLESDSVELKKEVKEVLKELKEEHDLGIISNGTGRLQRLKLKKTGILNLFKKVIISSEFGIGKPSEKVFEKAKKDIKADKYVMVSDVLERDVLASNRYGFEPVWVYSGDEDIQEQVKNELNIIKEFSELREIIEKIEKE